MLDGSILEVMLDMALSFYQVMKSLLTLLSNRRHLETYISYMRRANIEMIQSITAYKQAWVQQAVQVLLQILFYQITTTVLDRSLMNIARIFQETRRGRCHLSLTFCILTIIINVAILRIVVGKVCRP